jgi:hypothetical protein
MTLFDIADDLMTQLGVEGSVKQVAALVAVAASVFLIITSVLEKEVAALVAVAASVFHHPAHIRPLTPLNCACVTQCDGERYEESASPGG